MFQFRQYKHRFYAHLFVLRCIVNPLVVTWIIVWCEVNVFQIRLTCYQLQLTFDSDFKPPLSRLSSGKSKHLLISLGAEWSTVQIVNRLEPPYLLKKHLKIQTNKECSLSSCILNKMKCFVVIKTKSKSTCLVVF